MITLGRGGTRASKSRVVSQLVHSKCKRSLLHVTAASSKVSRGEDRARYTGGFIQYVKGTGRHERGLHWDLSLPGRGPCHTITKKPSAGYKHSVPANPLIIILLPYLTEQHNLSLLILRSGRWLVITPSFFSPPSLYVAVPSADLSSKPPESWRGIILKYANKKKPPASSAPCLLSTPLHVPMRRQPDLSTRQKRARLSLNAGCRVTLCLACFLFFSPPRVPTHSSIGSLLFREEGSGGGSARVQRLR